MAGPMRQGLPTGNTALDRAVFIAENSAIWTSFWGVWMLSAVGLFVFCTILADELKPSFLRTVGLSLVAMGIAPDLTAEVIYAFILPDVANSDGGLTAFVLLESIAVHLTGFLGNGLYNLGGLLLTLLAFKAGILKNWIAFWGVTAWVLGLLLSVSIALDAMAAAEAFTAISMVLSTLWMLIFAYLVLDR